MPAPLQDVRVVLWRQPAQAGGGGRAYGRPPCGAHGRAQHRCPPLFHCILLESFLDALRQASCCVSLRVSDGVSRHSMQTYRVLGDPYKTWSGTERYEIATSGDKVSGDTMQAWTRRRVTSCGASSSARSSPQVQPPKQCSPPRLPLLRQARSFGTRLPTPFQCKASAPV